MTFGISSLRRFLAVVSFALVASASGGAAEAAAKKVSIDFGKPAGTIVIVNNERKLYLVTGKGKALMYPIAVGKKSQVWTGTTRISKKAVNPQWLNPDDPLAEVVPGGPDNPLGERALYLGSTLYRIHGTPAAWSIGAAVSNGCIRMLNRDVKDLYKRVRVGTRVIAVNSKSAAVRTGSPKPVNMALYLKDKAKKKKAALAKLKKAKKSAVAFVN